MTQIKRLFGLALTLLSVVTSTAQTNGCNSSYSRFGLGLPCDQSQGFNRAMSGVAQGFRSKTQVNKQNPASYSDIDSLTFIFDIGMGLQMARMSGNGTSAKVNNTTLEYVNAGFRITPNLGMSLGFVPFSTIGYNFNTSNRVGSSPTSLQPITTLTTYYGNGGLHELYIGTGWSPFGNFSIGANIGYLWGDYNHSLAQSFYEGGELSKTYNTQNEVWSSDLKTFRLDIGVQYPIKISSDQKLTLGATAGIGHRIKSDVELLRYTSLGDSISNKVSEAFDLPYTISAGASWQQNDKLTIGLDYGYERWKGCRVPTSYATSTGSGIGIVKDQYKNRHHISAGAEYVHNILSRKYRERIRYRMGLSYSSSYLNVNGDNGPWEYGLTAGAALPLKTSTRSLINVSAEWLHRVPGVKGQIKENYLMIHLGITFNEAWFMKWKFQ